MRINSVTLCFAVTSFNFAVVSSFCSFWSEIDQNSRRLMSKEKSDSILKLAVKQFFVEKEVASTLVMDSLYSGLKSLQVQTKNKKPKGKCSDAAQLPIPIIWVEKDAFILADDVLALLQRAAVEPLPPKDDKGPQNRTKVSMIVFYPLHA